MRKTKHIFGEEPFNNLKPVSALSSPAKAMELPNAGSAYNVTIMNHIRRRIYNVVDIVIESVIEAKLATSLLVLFGSVMLTVTWVTIAYGDPLDELLIAWCVVLVAVGIFLFWKRRRQGGHPNHAAWAKHYDKVNERSFGGAYHRLTEATVRLVNGIGKNLAVIDFGAGTGRLSLPLSESGHQVTAVEPSKPMLYELEKKDARNRVTKRCASIADYSGRGSFDVALAVFTVIAYITEAKALKASLVNVASKLKPGGQLVIDIPHRILFQDNNISKDGITRKVRFVDKGNELYEYNEDTELEVDGKAVCYTDRALLRHWTEEQIVEALKGAGFNDIQRITDGNLTESDADTFAQSGATYLICSKATLTTSEKFWKDACTWLIIAIIGFSAWNNANKRSPENMQKDIAAAVQSKNARDLNQHGWAYSNGEKVEKNDLMAFKCWSEAVKLGDADAQAFVARALYKGRGAPQDMAEGLRMARLSDERGSVEGAFALADIFYQKYTTDHTTENGVTAFRWASKAANKRHPAAMMLLASLHKRGIGTQVDGAEAYKWIWLWRDIKEYDKLREISDEIRSKIEDRLSPEEMSEGRRRAELAIPALNNEK